MGCVGYAGLLSFRFTAARKTATNLTVSFAAGVGEIVCVGYSFVDDIRRYMWISNYVHYVEKNC